MKRLSTLGLALSVCFCGSAFADTLTISGATTPNSPTANVTFQTALLYQLDTFQVSSSGSYQFTTTADYANIVVAYDAAFDPVYALNNIIGSVTNTASPPSFTAELQANKTYALLNTSVVSGEYGNFTTVISGGGRILPVSPVPEPSEMALLLSGLGFVGALARRRVRTHRAGPNIPRQWSRKSSRSSALS